MTQQDAPSGLRRNADHNRTDALTDPDFQSVVLIILIGFLITACLASAFPLDDILVSLVALMLTTTPGPTADQQSPQQGCATRDVQTLILIEDHGEAGDLLPERVAKAGLMQMEARLACTAGRHAEGMALYDEIIRALGPVPSRVTRSTGEIGLSDVGRRAHHQ
jgi:hypothetical protein